MKLNLEQIKDISQGVERITEKDGEIYFFRFTEKEEKLYSTSELYPRIFSTAGVKLHFKTDATALLLRVRAEKMTNISFFAFDIYINKRYRGNIKNYPCDIARSGYHENDYPLGEFEESFDLPSGDKEIEIHFPCMLKGVLSCLDLADASYVTPVKQDKKFLAYGDSIAQGTAAQNPSRVHIVRLAEYFGAELHSKAMGSEVYFPELAILKTEEYAPDYIYVGYGVNDWYTLTYDDAESRCRRFWKAICENYPNAKKICVSPIWYRDYKEERPFGPLRDMEKLQRRVTSEYSDVIFVDGWELVPGSDDFFTDGVHPNNEGFDLFYNSLKDKINI